MTARIVVLGAAMGIFAASVVAGCGASQPSGDDFSLPLTEATFDPAKTPPPPKDEPKSEGGVADLNDDQKEQIKVALRRGGEKAQQCNKVSNATVYGEGEVQVVFDGKIGKATDATVGAPFAGTAIESCVKRSFIDEIIVPFDGTLTVPYTVKIEAPKAAAPDKKDGKKK